MIENFLTHLLENGKSAATAHSYRSDLAQFARWFEQTNTDPFTLESITPIDVREYRQYALIVEKAKPATINRRLAALRAFARWGVETGRISASPVTVREVRQQQTAPKWLDRRQQAALLRAVQLYQSGAKTDKAKMLAARDWALVVTGLNTGLRVGEFCALEMGDITLADRSGQIQVIGKGEKARTIPLNKTARQALREWLAIRPSVETNRVFLDKSGGSLCPRTLQRSLEKYGHVANLEVTPHVLRHTFAKNLVNSGVSLEKVAMLMGHSSMETTRLYITPSQADLKTAVESLDD